MMVYSLLWTSLLYYNDLRFKCIPVKNVIWIFSCLFDGSLVWFENETKSDGNPIIFLANASEIPWLELVQNPCHVLAWKTNKTWINDMESSWNLVWISTKLPSICDVKWHGISMRIHVIFFTGYRRIMSASYFVLFSNKIRLWHNFGAFEMKVLFK